MLGVLTQSLPLLLREDAKEKAISKAVPAGAPSTEAREHHPLLCRECRAEISDEAFLFTMDGDSAVRVFSNPSGRLCEILTLRHAQGLSFTGPPTTEFTWFPGYAWEVALCASCLAHLGWRFSATAREREPAEFYGLLRAALL